MSSPTKPVEQKARELLAELVEAVRLHCNEPGGGGISGYLGARLTDAQNFLAEPIAALNTDGERIRREAFEEAAKVADRYLENEPTKWTDAAGVEASAEAAVHIAEVIRSLSTPSKGVG